MRRLAGWLVWSAAVLAAVLAVATFATARHGDPALYPPRGEGARVEVLVVSHGYHAGLVVPRTVAAEVARRRGLAALAAAAARFEGYGWLEIGWGDEGFYTQVPTMASLTAAMALRALFRPGNRSMVHLVGLLQPARVSFPAAEIVALELGEAGFERLAAGLDASFARNAAAGTIEELGPGLYGPSLFFRAVGTFSIFKVCNHWVGDRLAAAGVPTAPVADTTPQGLLWDLRWRAGAVPVPAAAQ
jgi:uncharacterized protein (TIGR02117 family)